MMRTPLRIGICLDQTSPTGWMRSLLERLDQQALLRVVWIQIGPSQPVENSPSSEHSWMSQWLLDRVDRPRFDASGLQAAEWPEHSSEPLRAVRDSVDVIIHVHDDPSRVVSTTVSAGKHWFIPPGRIVGEARTALVRNAELLRVYVLDFRPEDQHWSRVAVHALPMQSYSLTDISSYALGCLPAVLTSRLLRVAHDETLPALDEVGAPLPGARRSADSTQLQRTILAHRRTSLWSDMMGVASLALRQTWDRCRSRLLDEQWQLASACLPTEGNPLAPARQSIGSYRSVPTPAGRMWADPHLLTRNGVTHVFFEDLDFREKKGRIRVAQLSASGELGKDSLALEEPYHLSYPFVFEHDGEVFMIPETASRRTVTLYRATHYPLAWEPVRNLLEHIDTADSTMLYHDGWWWMFSNGKTCDAVDERDELNVWFCRDFLTDRLQPHPLNPVLTGVDCARMAGVPFQWEGEWYRPSQFGARRYGYGINLNRIDSLSTQSYQETLVQRQTAADAAPWLGCHTYSVDGTQVLVDRLRRVRKHRG